jgi:hypothetical protein
MISNLWSASAVQAAIDNQVEDILASVDQLTQGLSEELNTKIEKTQLGSQAVMTSISIRSQSLRKESDYEIQGP